MKGIFLFENNKYEFSIVNNEITFSALNLQDAKRWQQVAKDNNFVMNLELNGKSDTNEDIVILTDFYKRNRNISITLGVKAVFVFNNKVETIKGVSIGTNENVKIDELSIDYSKFSVIKDIGLMYYKNENGNFIISKNEELTYSNVLDIAYLMINTFRFLIQSNSIGYTKIYFLTDNGYGYICNCKEIEKYYNNNPKFKLQQILEGVGKHIESVLEHMDKKQIYMAHIQETSKLTNINPGVLINILAAFEWESRFIDIGEMSESSKNDKEVLLKMIDELIDNAKGKSKKHFKSYRKIINNIELTLSEKLCRTFKKYDKYIKPIAGNGYVLNNMELDYSKMGDRLQNQRNNFAHGNLDMEINPIVAIDLKILRALLFILQLDKCGLTEIDIKKSYDIVFEENIYLHEKELTMFNDYIQKLCDESNN